MAIYVMRYDVPLAMIKKVTAFGDMTSYRLVDKDRRFG
jgi:hypothetical protein